MSKRLRLLQKELDRIESELKKINEEINQGLALTEINKNLKRDPHKQYKIFLNPTPQTKSNYPS